MIGRLDDTKREAVVVGAGIAGLLAAYFLDRAGYEVTIFEEQPRAGGLIHTENTPFGIAEAAAHSYLASPPVAELCRDLGVELCHVRKESRARFILRDGKPRRFPLTLPEAAGLVARAAFSRAPWREEGFAGPSMADWALRHLGPAGRDYLIGPFVTGIHAALPEALSQEAAFPSLSVPPGKTLLGAMLSRKRNGHACMVAPRGGMGALVGALERRLRGRLGDRFHVATALDVMPSAPNVVIATPAYRAAKLVRISTTAHARSDQQSGAAGLLDQVAYTPLVAMTVFADIEGCENPPRGVGVLVPARERRRVLGILFNSSSFEGRVADEKRHASLTVMMGGSVFPEAVRLSDDELLAIARGEISELLGVGKIVHAVIRKRERALPLYSPSLAQIWQGLQNGWCTKPGRILFGNYTGSLSLRGMIEDARRMEIP